MWASTGDDSHSLKQLNSSVLLERDVDTCGHTFVLKEANPLRRVWEVVLGIVLGYIATVLMFRLAFLDMRIPNYDAETSLNWQVVDWIVYVLFWFDLIIGFFTSFRDAAGNEVISIRQCALMYLSTFFLVNFIACVPEAWLRVAVLNMGATKGTLQDASQALKAFRFNRFNRMVRLFKLRSLPKLANLRRTAVGRWILRHRGVQCVQFLCTLMVAVHFLACLWYLAAAMNGRTVTDAFGNVVEDYSHTWVGRRELSNNLSLLEHGPFDHWLHSFYFVLTVFSTVGFGDMSSFTIPEIVCVAVIIVVGAVVHSIVISEVISIVTRGSQVDAFIQTHERMFESFGENCKISEHCKFTLQHWFRDNGQRFYNEHYSRDAFEHLCLHLLPREILIDLASGLFNGRLASNRFFSPLGYSFRVSPRMPVLLAVYLHESIFLALDIVYQLHDAPSHVFFVSMGTFACVGCPHPETGGVDSIAIESDSELSVVSKVSSGRRKVSHHRASMFPYMIFSRNSYFGEIEMFSGTTRLSTVRCETNTGQALACSRDNWTKFIRRFPEMCLVWHFAAAKRRRLRERSLRRLTSKRTHCQLAGATILRYMQLGQRGQGLRRRRAEKIWKSVHKLSTEPEVGLKASKSEKSSLDELQQTIEMLNAEISEFREALFRQPPT
eukprot:TRINITY_DN27283_c0_g1_i1.p1 TRINITY_DN27283_c0_g1~~TRINITY_DN27283_c0_g1_i1.p1  ORF type:complete len:665 (+),score=59.38 TRINITY_DN27283_c0_g1_i1:59-2053(+)